VKTIDREHIFLNEEYNSGYSLTDGSNIVSRWWTAAAKGSLSTGENIFIEREGKTAEEAYRALEAALNEQKWTIKV